MDNNNIHIDPAPPEIQKLLDELRDDPSKLTKRNISYIRIPGKTNAKGKIAITREIIEFALNKQSKKDIINFIQKNFEQDDDSARQAFNAIKNCGLIQRVQYKPVEIYVATNAAKEWYYSNNDINLIRIIHSHKRFIGEMILFTKEKTKRKKIREEAEKFGLLHSTIEQATNTIIGFLCEAGLVDDLGETYIQATLLGLEFVSELPLESIPDNHIIQDEPKDDETVVHAAHKESDEENYEALISASRNPSEGNHPVGGTAFELETADVFKSMGFEAERIAGSGKPDVVVKWVDNNGEEITAIVENKSSGKGKIEGGDFEATILGHKKKYAAKYIAITVPDFRNDGAIDTVYDLGASPITVEELIYIAENSKNYDIPLTDIALLFKVPNGLSELKDIISKKKRQFEIITNVISVLKEEHDIQKENDSFSIRDISMILRGHKLYCSMEEINEACELLSQDVVGILDPKEGNSKKEEKKYSFKNNRQQANRIRVLADAIEKGLS